MSKGLGSIDRDISTIETAYAGNPQALSSKIQKDRSRGVSQSLLELMALEKMNAEKDAIKNQMIKSKNITTESRATQSGEVFIDGFKVKAVGGVDSSRLKIKTKKFN